MDIYRSLHNSRKNKSLIGGSLSKVVKKGDFVIKYYDGNYLRGYEKLEKEIKYLQEVPEEKKRFFPRVIEVEKEKKFIAYSMPFYYDFKTISDLMFSKRDVKKVWTLLKKSLDIAQEIFYSGQKIKPPKNYKKRTHLDRINSSLDFFRISEDYRDLFDQEEIFLNGEKLVNIPQIIKRLKSDKEALDLLLPKDLTFFHGNFHTDNILTDGAKILFVDPRGEKFGSEDYDKSKMFTHLFLEYDLIHVNKFKIKKNGNSFNVSIDDKRVSKRYLYLQKKFLEYELKRYKNNQEFIKKMMLIGAIHSLSFSTYHARKDKPDKNRILAYYFGAVKMFNYFFNKRNLNIKERAFDSK